MVEMPRLSVRSLDSGLEACRIGDLFPQQQQPQMRTSHNKVQAMDGLTVAQWWDDRPNNRTHFQIVKGIQAVWQHKVNKHQPGYGYRVMQPGEKFEEFERMSRAALKNKRMIE